MSDEVLTAILHIDAVVQRRAVAKAITLLESTRADHRCQADLLLAQLLPLAGKSFRLGISGVSSVRQGKHFELDVDDSVDTDTLARLADVLLSNPVIEDYAVRRE